MASYSLPWYGAVKRIVAPTEPIANLALLLVVLLTLYVLVKGDQVHKAGLAAYWWSP